MKPIIFMTTINSNFEILILSDFILPISYETSLESLLSKLSKLAIPEACIAQAWYQRCCGELDQAYNLLLPVIQRAPHLLQPFVLILEVAMQGEMGDRVLPALRPALEKHGEHPALLGFVTTANLLRRMSGLARRSSLQQRCWASIQSQNNHIDNPRCVDEPSLVKKWFNDK